jgi:hypothetical protein
MEHDLFGKPVSTFPDHALGGTIRRESDNVLIRRITSPRLGREGVG